MLCLMNLVNLFGKKCFLLVSAFLVFSCSWVGAQTLNPEYEKIVDKCSYDSLVKDIKHFDGLGIKEMETEAINNTRDWIMARYKRLGYEDIVVDSFERSGLEGENLIITKKGKKYPNKYFVIDAHYDTKNGPGANDNGSGTVILLEIARLLKDIETDYSIKFIHFSGEEDGLYGSSHYVRNIAVPDSLDITLLFNIDQVGGVKNDVNNRISCEKDAFNVPTNNRASADATDYLAKCVELYSNLYTEITVAYASDYIPFETAGYVITGFFEYNESPFGHSQSDTWENMDLEFLHQVAKAAIGATLHFAEVGKKYVGLQAPEAKGYAAYPNPVKDRVFVVLEEPGPFTVWLTDALGRVLTQQTFEEGEPIVLSMTDYPASSYFLMVESRGGGRQALQLIKE